MTTLTKANVCKFGRNAEGILMEPTAIAEKFIGKLFTQRHVKRAAACLAAIQRGIILKAKYMDSLAKA